MAVWQCSFFAKKMSTTAVNEEDVQDLPPSDTENRNIATTPYYTIILLSSIVIVFLAQATMPIDAVVMIAGLVKPLFGEGEYWRVLTASFLHADILHIAFNGFALFMLGRGVETISNKAIIPLVFLLGAVSGGILSFVFEPTGNSIGASGGVIGLLGFLTVYGYKRRKLLSNALLKDMLFNIGFIGILGVFVIPNVDNFGHLGGLIAGAIVGFFQIPTDPYKDPRVVGKPLQIAGLTALIVSCLIALATAGMILYWFIRIGQ